MNTDAQKWDSESSRGARLFVATRLHSNAPYPCSSVFIRVIRFPVPRPSAALRVSFLLLASALLLSGCGPKAMRFHYTEVHMGMPAEITVYAEDEPAARAAARAAYERIAHLDSVMSDYREDSELMRLAGRAGDGPVEISTDLYRVLEHSLHYAELSGGAFDPTIGPLVEMWRVAAKFHQMPTEDSLRRAKGYVNWRNLRLDPTARTAELVRGRMKLDLGAIGKGFAADEAFEVLRQRGMTRALVNLGGDLRAGDPPPGKSFWIVDVQSGPEIGSAKVKLVNGAMATSGDAFQFVELGGVRYSHIVDPRTGLGLTTRLSVTVAAPDCTTADALASIVSVLGPEESRSIVENFPGVNVTTVKPGERAQTFGAGYDDGFTIGGG